MIIKRLTAVAASLVLVGVAASAYGHGFVQDPPARNAFCGWITKPDQVLNGVAQFPVCGDASSRTYPASTRTPDTTS